MKFNKSQYIDNRFHKFVYFILFDTFSSTYYVAVENTCLRKCLNIKNIRLGLNNDS